MPTLLSARSSSLRDTSVVRTQEAEERVFASVASSHSGAGAADGEDEEDDAHAKLLRSASHPIRRCPAIGVMMPLDRFLRESRLYLLEAQAAATLHGARQSM